MKRILFLPLLIAPCMARQLPVEHAETRVWMAAKDTSIEGKGVPMACKKFALAAKERFETAGVSCRIIKYHWRKASQEGKHAIVVFSYAGKIYAVDNFTWRPKLISGDAPHAWAQSFAGFDVSILEAEVLEYQNHLTASN